FVRERSTRHSITLSTLSFLYCLGSLARAPCVTHVRLMPDSTPDSIYLDHACTVVHSEGVKAWLLQRDTSALPLRVILPERVEKLRDVSARDDAARDALRKSVTQVIDDLLGGRPMSAEARPIKDDSHHVRRAKGLRLSTCGVFTKRHFEAYQAVGVYTGKYWTDDEFNALALGKCNYFKYSMQIGSWGKDNLLVVDATELGNDMRELNHYQDLTRPRRSPTLNARYLGAWTSHWPYSAEVRDNRKGRDEPYLVIITTCAVPQDTELLIDYGRDYFLQMMASLYAELSLQHEQLLERDNRIAALTRRNALLAQQAKALSSRAAARVLASTKNRRQASSLPGSPAAPLPLSPQLLAAPVSIKQQEEGAGELVAPGPMPGLCAQSAASEATPQACLASGFTSGLGESADCSQASPPPCAHAAHAGATMHAACHAASGRESGKAGAARPEQPGSRQQAWGPSAPTTPLRPLPGTGLVCEVPGAGQGSLGDCTQSGAGPSDLHFKRLRTDEFVFLEGVRSLGNHQKQPHTQEQLRQFWQEGWRQQQQRQRQQLALTPLLQYQ
ncbi:hypothetical protein QJQ45_014721, partial [Haematococcus lacustris]